MPLLQASLHSQCGTYLKHDDRLPVLSAVHSVSLAGSDAANLLEAAAFIIWDEAPMMHKFNFEALDRCLKDIMRHKPDGRMPFGGKVIMFCGDFRQIPTIIPRGSRAAIVDASLKRSYLWPLLRKMQLTINMRVRRLAGTQAYNSEANQQSLLPLKWMVSPWLYALICCIVSLL